MYWRVACFLLFGLFFSVVPEHVLGFGPTTAPSTRLQTRYSGLVAPIFLTHAGDGSKRVFILERNGIIKVVQPGSNKPTDFLDITSLTSVEGERGLLGLAFHPSFSTNRRFFVYFTRVADGALQISEFEASPFDPNIALTTEKPILTIPHASHFDHNGGTIAFGPDGFLYAAPGDGGGGTDPANNAQNIDSLLGKVLRINVDVPAGENTPYLIPPDNPFAGATAGADEIFATGFRNPFRWSFDRGGTQQLWLGDVGQDSWEEVDVVVKGGNYGWRVYEGDSCTGAGPAPCEPANYVSPAFVYSSQNTSSRCSVTGGYVYRGGLKTLPNGAYIYGDFCTGEVIMWNDGVHTVLHDISDFNLVSFGEDEDGELYVVFGGSGIIQKIVPSATSADFDGDRSTDLSLFRPSDSTWYLLNANTYSFRIQQFGAAGDIPAPADMDGDGITDLTIFRPSEGRWYHIKSGQQIFEFINWGEAGDIPVAGDYDGDSRADHVLYRPSTGTWFVRQSSDLSLYGRQWGTETDIPVPGDYDGDGRYDFAVWRPSNGIWYTIASSNKAMKQVTFGETGDVPTPGDFDNDGRNDFSLYRPSEGRWYQRLTWDDRFGSVAWGIEGDIPVPGDYDSDGKDDIGLFRPSIGTWYIIQSNLGLLQITWGVNKDIPLPNLDTP